MAYSGAGKTKDAHKVYQHMLGTGVTPTSYTYTAFITAGVGIVPNSYTYLVLIKGLAADPNFFGDAKKYLLETMDKGKQPNAATYTAVIETFYKAAEDEGKQFVEVMILKGRPTPVIRRIMVIVLSKLKG